MSSVVVSDLAFGHPGADQLFFDVSFGVSPGEHAAIVGPNGVGKSTILRILSGVLEADEGNVTTRIQVIYVSEETVLARELWSRRRDGSELSYSMVEAESDLEERDWRQVENADEERRS